LPIKQRSRHDVHGVDPSEDLADVFCLARQQLDNSSQRAIIIKPLAGKRFDDTVDSTPPA